MKGIGHTTVEVDPMFKSQIRQNGYTKVPQLKVMKGGKGGEREGKRKGEREKGRKEERNWAYNC